MRQKITGTVSEQMMQIKVLVKEIYDITEQPVTLSGEDWEFLRVRGQFSMRVPHDETQALLAGVPVRKQAK